MVKKQCVVVCQVGAVKATSVVGNVEKAAPCRLRGVLASGVGVNGRFRYHVFVATRLHGECAMESARLAGLVYWQSVGCVRSCVQVNLAAECELGLLLVADAVCVACGRDLWSCDIWVYALA